MSNKQTFKLLIKYIGKSRILLIMNIILAIPAVISMLLIPVFTGKVIDLLYTDFTIEQIVKAASMIPVFAGIYALLLWFIGFFSGRIAYNTVKNIRSDAAGVLEKLPLSYIDSHSHGEMINTVISDTDRICEGLEMLFKEFFTGIFTIVGTIALMLSISPVVTLAVVLLTPVSLFVAKFISKKTYGFFGQEATVRAAHASYLEEMIAGRKVIKAYANEKKALSDFDIINDELGKKSLKAVFFSSLVNPTTRFTNSLIYAFVAFLGAMLCTGAFGVAGGTFTVGSMTVFLSYASQYAKPFNEISGVISELQNSLACASRVFDFISLPIEEEDVSESFEDDRPDSSGSVTFDHVSFSYVKDRPLIRDFSLDVKPGTHVAIVGKTGAGKTTLINLLMRFYDCSNGKIIIDGKNISEVPRRALRSRFGLVLQETWLISGTIYENLSFGLTEPQRDTVIAAAKETMAHNFIKKLPNGYDTYISEDDALLSEGQKQLLCITRVLAADPSILILDEATSSVDALTETRIKNALEKLSSGKTSFTVAHRLSTIRNADMILFIENGNIEESGTHEELLEKGGLYASLYGSQFSPEGE